MRRQGNVVRALGGIAAALLALAPGPQAVAREVDAVVDLRTAPSWHVKGASSIGPVGDVNGDGFDDAAVADCGAVDHAGEVRVVWGPFEADEVTFETAGDGFSIRGSMPSDFACRLAMHPVGDVNGDGLADVLVGASKYSGGPATIYVVFGKSDTEPVELRTFDEGMQGGRGYVVHHWNVFQIGTTGLGDMNGDGLADFAVGGGRETYVVFGQNVTFPVDLRTLDLAAGRGFVIKNRCRECVFGFAGAVGRIGRSCGRRQR